MNYDLTTVMRQVWHDEKETDPRKAARYVRKLIPDEFADDVLQDLLTARYSTFLSMLSREEPREPRRTPAVNPRVRGVKVMADLDNRPFFVPSAGELTRVLFKDMTAECWAEWAQSRRRKATGYLRSAEWGELNITRLEEYQAQHSGELPDEVKYALFSSRPGD